MPLLVKDYIWRQTQDLVIVRVPLKGVPLYKIDIFHTDVFIKVHFPPYLFEACLYQSIDESLSRCILAGEEAVFELKKKCPEEWPYLNKDLSKAELLEIKKGAIESSHERAEGEKKERAKMRDQWQKQCVKEQIALDTKEREGIENIKKNERETAAWEIEQWKKSRSYDNPTVQQLSNFAPTTYQRDIRDFSQGNQGPIFNEGDVREDAKIDVGSTESTDKISLKNKNNVLPKISKPEFEIPGPRKTSTIEIHFSHRAFPTPSRESKLSEEEEWLKKQLEARRKIGFVAEDLRPEENDPIWLLDKARSFMEVGNYLGAVSAYTHGIKLTDMMPELFVGRSSAQLTLGNFRRAVDDTTKALELLKPYVASNADLRFEAHMTRGQALMKLGLPRAAEADFECALEIRPKDTDCSALLFKAELMDEEETSLPFSSQISSNDLG